MSAESLRSLLARSEGLEHFVEAPFLTLMRKRARVPADMPIKTTARAVECVGKVSIELDHKLGDTTTALNQLETEIRNQYAQQLSAEKGEFYCTCHLEPARLHADKPVRQ